MDNGHTLARAIVDTIREPLLVLDKDLRVVTASRSFFTTFGLDVGEVAGRAMYDLAGGRWNIPELRLLLETILPQHAVMEAYEVEQDFPGIGRRTMLLNARTVSDAGGDRALILLAIEDVTQQRTHIRELGALLREKETLLQEVPHRVSNSLQIIASILSLKAQTVQSEEIREHLQDAHRRVLSVAAVQRQLQISKNLDRISMGSYLSRLCQALAESMIGDSRPITLKIEADGGTATSTTAVSVGLIVTELVINALKHAFVDGRAGGVIVIRYHTNAPAWRLEVADDGVGMADQATPGLGTSIVEALSKQLDADVKVSVTSRGTTVSIAHGESASLAPVAA
ncbi:MAG: PAS domain-containing protein [Reyranella sp.]|nr:PAS domain-containing protein [Reyranella sp.]